MVVKTCQDHLNSIGCKDKTFSLSYISPSCRDTLWSKLKPTHQQQVACLNLIYELDTIEQFQDLETASREKETEVASGSITLIAQALAQQAPF